MGGQTRTATEIVMECNELACKFYAAHGYRVREGYKFFEATHPQEIAVWEQAVMAYDHIQGTDVIDCLGEYYDEP